MWELIEIQHAILNRINIILANVLAMPGARASAGLILTYHQVSNIRCTKSQHLKDSRSVLRMSLPNPLKPDVKSRMKMYLEQRRQAMLQLHLSDRQFYCLLRYVLY